MNTDTEHNYADGPVVLFDGECHLCDFSVGFILRHERDEEILFAPLQSEVGHDLVPSRDDATPDSVVYVRNDTVLFRSDAAIAIARHLKIPWRWMGCIRWLPRSIRDPLYRLVASYRYRIFGRKEVCEIPRTLKRNRQLTKD